MSEDVHDSNNIIWQGIELPKKKAKYEYGKRLLKVMADELRDKFGGEAIVDKPAPRVEEASNINGLNNTLDVERAQRWLQQNSEVFHFLQTHPSERGIAELLHDYSLTVDTAEASKLPPADKEYLKTLEKEP